MAYYHYSQSNPGGFYVAKPAKHVYILAASAEEADAIAETVGVYFDGIGSGEDCPCCNDRWERAWSEYADKGEVCEGIDYQKYSYSNVWYPWRDDDGKEIDAFLIVEGNRKTVLNSEDDFRRWEAAPEGVAPGREG